MESSLHRQLKKAYARPEDQMEVPVDGYRIDVLAADRLIEIQHGSLAAISAKISRLIVDHSVLVVKPIIATKKLVWRDRKRGRVVRQRMSPKRGEIFDLFDELIYFTRVFPHPNLALEVPLVDIEEWRYPGHGRRRRRRPRDHQVEDQRLMRIGRVFRFKTAMDLAELVPRDLPSPFHTAHLAEAAGIERRFAQRIAYCFRHMGTIVQVGKQGNAILYAFAEDRTAAA